MAGMARRHEDATAVIQCSARTIHDHIKCTALQCVEAFIVAAVSSDVLNASGNRVLSAREQGEGMALGHEPGYQRLAHKTGSSHHQNLHDVAPPDWLGRFVVLTGLKPGKSKGWIP